MPRVSISWPYVASHRTRSMTSLFAGAAISATGYLAVITVVPLIAEDVLGGPRWSGVPSAVAILGTAFGTSALSAIMARHGRRRGLLVGYSVSAVAALIAAAAAASSLLPLLALAVFSIGAGYSASRLTRYAAADLYEPARQSSAIGWMVWAGTIGSVLGPMLLEPTRQVSEWLGIPESVGPFVLATITFGVSWLVLLVALPTREVARMPVTAGTEPSVLSRPARNALIALVVAQGVMVLIMTMTPIHVRAGGNGLATIGGVIASHTFGMYALSPVSGFLSDRWGRIPVILAATVIVAASGVLAASATSLAVPLFLLGFGWNLAFVAGSALLTESTPESRRVRVQGLADTLSWTTAAVAGASSGVLLSEVGFATLSYIGASIALVPAIAIGLGRGR